ncbi:MAG: type II secretion system minor pseudopilin GspI [Lautropia sp.]|nr:type II secretion system minor pseudopilin GspI [Lautropia sp.]
MATKCFVHRNAQAVSGFTLIEVLVALTIIAIALMASLRAVGSITAGADDLRARTLAQWSAENRLTEIRVRGEFPAVGRRNYDCPQGDLLLVCQEDVYATANPNFRRIEMQVFDPSRSERSVGGALQGGRLARLLGFAIAGGTVGG